MSSFETKWNDYQNEQSLCRNYRNLKRFIESDAAKTWAFFSKKGEYLEQIRIVSKLDLIEYHPDKDLDQFLEKHDEPFPVYHKHFFSHLPLQLTFFDLNKLLNLLDFHFRSYAKYFPGYEEAFLRELEGNVVRVVEHNKIANYDKRVELILAWVRKKYEHLEILQKSKIEIVITSFEFVDLSITNINNFIIQKSEPLITSKVEVSKPESPPTQKSIEKPEIPLTLKPELKQAFINELSEHLIIDENPRVVVPFPLWLNNALKGNEVHKYFTIKNGSVEEFCKIFLSYHKQKAFGKIFKATLAKWIRYYFRKIPSGSIDTLSYNTVYNILKGSKKKKGSR